MHNKRPLSGATLITALSVFVFSSLYSGVWSQKDAVLQLPVQSGAFVTQVLNPVPHKFSCGDVVNVNWMAVQLPAPNVTSDACLSAMDGIEIILLKFVDSSFQFESFIGRASCLAYHFFWTVPNVQFVNTDKYAFAIFSVRDPAFNSLEYIDSFVLECDAITPFEPVPFSFVDPPRGCAGCLCDKDADGAFTFCEKVGSFCFNGVCSIDTRDSVACRQGEKPGCSCRYADCDASIGLICDNFPGSGFTHTCVYDRDLLQAAGKELPNTFDVDIYTGVPYDYETVTPRERNTDVFVGTTKNQVTLGGENSMARQSTTRKETPEMAPSNELVLILVIVLVPSFIILLLVAALCVYIITRRTPTQTEHQTALTERHMPSQRAADSLEETGWTFENDPPMQSTRIDATEAARSRAMPSIPSDDSNSANSMPESRGYRADFFGAVACDAGADYSDFLDVIPSITPTGTPRSDAHSRTASAGYSLEKSFVCNICSKGYHYQEDLDEHTYRRHR